MDESIEIHFDDKRGALELACGPDAFRAFRDFASRELGDLPDLPWEKVESIEVLDTATFVARRNSRKTAVLTAGCLVVALTFAIFCLIGVATVLRWWRM